MENRPLMKDIFANYLDVYLVHQNVKENSMVVASANIKNLMYFGKKRFDQVKVQDLVTYINKRKAQGASPNTIRREFSVLHSSLNVAVKFELIPKFNGDGDYSIEYNIAKHLLDHVRDHRPSGDKRKVRPTLDGANRIVTHLDISMKKLVKAAVMTGYRKSELLSLTFKDIDLKNKEIRLDETKNGEGRISPMYNELFVFMNNMMVEAQRKVGGNLNNVAVFREEDQSEMKIANTYRRWRAAVVKAGFTDGKGKHLFNFHDLRKLAIRYLKEKYGFDRDLIADCFTGHKDMSIFEEVYNIRSSDTFSHYKKEILNK